MKSFFSLLLDSRTELTEVEKVFRENENKNRDI